MAKEIVIKVKVDGQEIDVAKKSSQELTKQIGDLKAKLETVPLGSKEFKNINADINALERGFQKAKDAQQPFIQSMSQLPGIVGYAGRSLKGLKEGFDLLLENPIVAVFAAVAAVVLKVAEKMKDLEGVMDPLEKIGKAVSGVFDTLANTILPPVAALLETIAEGAGKVANFFGTLFGASNKVGDAMSYVAETMDHLNDTNAEFELNQAKANRALQEAREIAIDATKPIGVRVQALKDAEKIERDIAEKARAREVEKAHAQAIELANSLGYTDQQIAAIKKYDAAQLESFLTEIQLKKGLNRQKSDDLYKTLAAIEESAAQEARIGKKTQTQITGLEKEEQTKREEARKKAAEQTKDYITRLATFENDTRLNNIKDEQEKARVALEIDRKKSLDEINGLELSEKRKKSLREAAAKDFDSKMEVLTAKQKADNDKKRKDELDAETAFNYKVQELQISTNKNELQANKDKIDLKAKQDKEAYEKDTNFKKKSAEEQARILALVDEKARQDKQKLDDDDAKKQNEKKLKDLDDQLKFLQIKGEAITKGTKAYYDNLRDISAKAEERELAATGLTEEEKTAIKQKYAAQRKDIDKQELNSYLGYASGILAAANNIFSNISDINQKQMDLDLKAAKGNAEEEDKIKRKYFEKNKQTQIAQAIIGTLQAAVQAYQSLAVIPVVGPILGAAAAAAALVFGYKQVDLIRQQQYESTSSATQSSSSAAPPPQAKPQGYGDGGMINGPRHAAGGVLINAEGGEAIMTRGSVAMFGPMLSMMNQLGGGKSFAPNALVSTYDSPKSSYPSDFPQSPVQIVKTYVVEGELTSAQQKQARLKALSTI